MKKEEKIIDIPKLFRIVFVLFCICLTISTVLAFWSFQTPPPGIIDPSVLQTISIVMGSVTAFEGFVLGFIAIVKGKKTSAKIGNVEIIAEDNNENKQQ